MFILALFNLLFKVTHISLLNNIRRIKVCVTFWLPICVMQVGHRLQLTELNLLISIPMLQAKEILKVQTKNITTVG